MDLVGKVAVVTGASRGIGRATALRLANEGCDIAVVYRQNTLAAEAVCKEVEGCSRRAFAYRVDLSQPGSAHELRLRVENDLGCSTVLVNNAGEIARPADWKAQTDSEVSRAVSVNLLSVIYCIREFAPGMADRGAGRIVNLTTTYSFHGAAPVLAYTAAKAGVNAVTTAMAAELGGSGVTVNAVAPGNIDTEMTAAAGESIVSWAVETTPLGRLGTPDEVAEAIAFVARHDFITGHILTIDGGQILKI